MRESVDSTMLMHVSDCSKSQKMCNKSKDKGSKMLKFVPDYFKNKKMCKNAVKKLFFAIIHVSD